MPYLPEAKCPKPLTPRASCIEEIAGGWRVAYARPQYEKPLAWALLRRGIPYYLPLCTDWREYRVKDKRSKSGWRIRRVKVKVPLIAGYVFFAGDWRAVDAAFNTGFCSAFIPIADDDQAPLRDFLIRLHNDDPKGERRPIEVDGLQIGEDCQITAGQWAELRGTFDGNTPDGQAVLSYLLFGQQRKVVVPRGALQSVA